MITASLDRNKSASAPACLWLACAVVGYGLLSGCDGGGQDNGGAPEPDVASTILWQDAFDDAVITGRGYALRGEQAIVPGRSGNAVQFPYSDASTDNLIEHTFSTATNVYFRYWYKTSPGADPTCGDKGGSGFKWFMPWRAVAQRYTMGVGMLDNGGPGSPSVGIEFTSHDNTSTGMPNPFLQNISTEKRFDTTNDGQWHKYTLHVVTGAGGYEQIWVDDLLILDSNGYGYDHSDEGIAMFQFPGVVVEWFGGCDFSIAVDDLVVWQ